MISIPAAYVRHGVKTGLACLLSYEGSRLLGLPYAFWAVISTVIVMQVYVADSVKMCLYRFFGTAIGAVIGIFAIWAFPAGELWNDAAIFLTLGFCAFMTRYSPKYRMAAITVSVVAIGSFGTPMDERIYYAFWRVVEITVGVGSAFLVSVLVFPERLEKELETCLESQGREAAALCRGISETFVRGERPAPEKELYAWCSNVMKNRESLSGITHHELLFERRQRGDTLASRIARMERVSAHIRVMAHALTSEALLKERFYMEAELLALSDACAACLEITSSTDEALAKGVIQESLEACDKHLKALREEGATYRFDLEMIGGFYEYYNALRGLSRECLE